MNKQYCHHRYAGAAALLVMLNGANMASAQQGPQPGPPNTGAPSGAPPPPDPAREVEEPALSSVEQGQTPLSDSFDFDFRQWRLERRRKAFEDTQFKVNFRTMYLDRDKYDNSESEAWAIGGWAGLKTGYFLDHIAFGATGYTSQHLYGDDDTDGTLMLEPGQGGYEVLGELYADIRIIDGLNLYIGRKEYDTPYINKNDTRMTPNTFEAISLMGVAKFGGGGGGGDVVVGGSGKDVSGKDGKTTVADAKPPPGATLKYGIAYFDRIKERNSDEFISMAEDAGADVERGVFTAGALYQKGNFSIGAIDYYSPDILNIAYFEAKQEFPLSNGLKPRLAVQFTDQRSVGDNLLQGDDFSARQWGVKAELPVGPALFTAGFTSATGDANMRNPWSGYPGYTSVQVEDFNRDGEDAFILRAAYDFKPIKGLSAYALWVHGTEPDDPGQFARDEYNVNLQWAPPEGVLKGFSIRLRYALDDQHGGAADEQSDLRVICNYAISF